MADRTVSIRFVADMTQFNGAVAKGVAQTNAMKASTSGMASSTQQSMSKMGRASGTLQNALGGINPMLVGAGGLAYGIKEVAGAAIGWESAFAGVKKTVNGTPEQLSAISDGIRQMSKEIPTSAADLAAIAESAGQLGIETDNVLEFTRTIADLGETTNLAGQEGATQLARFANITGMAQEDFGRLGSTLVELGNNFETTEAEISDMALRIAGAGTQIGLTEGEILGISTALSSVGIAAEAGGSAISKIMIDIASQVENGGEKLEQFAAVAGMAPEQFAQAWRTDAAGALNEFVSGLGRLESEGGSALGTLEDLGITEVRMRDALLRAAGAGDLLTDALDTQSGAWEDNNALQAEAAQRYETTEAKIQVAKNAIGDLATELGEGLLPVLGAAAEGMTDFLGMDLGNGLDFTEAFSMGLTLQVSPSQFVDQVIAAAESAAEEASKAEPEVEVYVKPEPVRTGGGSFEWELPPMPPINTTEATNALARVDSAVEESKGTWDGIKAPEPDWSRIEEGSSVLGDAREWLGEHESDIRNIGEEYAYADERLENYLNKLREATDPMFALQEAVKGVEEAQEGYTDALEGVGDAEGAVIDAKREHKRAQEDLAAAQKDGETSARELEDAELRVAESSAAVSAAERDQERALGDVEDAAWRTAEAAANLEDKALSGEVSFQDFADKLDYWVDRGEITKGQADKIRERVEMLRGESEDYTGDYEAEFEAHTETARRNAHNLRDAARAYEGNYGSTFSADTARAAARIRELRGIIGSIPRSITTRATVSYATRGNPVVNIPGRGRIPVGSHTGGWAGQGFDHDGVVKPDEVPTVLQDGEYVVRRSEARRHAALLEAINGGRMHYGGWASRDNVASASPVRPASVSVSVPGSGDASSSPIDYETLAAHVARQVGGEMDRRKLSPADIASLNRSGSRTLADLGA